MPILAMWLTSLFSGLTVYFSAWLAKRAALIAAGIATFSSMVITLYTVMAGLISGMQASFPQGGLIATGIWLFVPDNAPAALSVMIAADTALSLFFWQQVNLNIALRGVS